MINFRCFLLIIFLTLYTPLLGQENIDKHVYFSEFKESNYLYLEHSLQSDSIPFKTRLTDKIELKNNIIAHKIKVSFKEDVYEFWIGIGNNGLYCFKNNNLSKPKFLIDFNEKEIKKNVKLHPFCKNYNIELSQFFYSNGEPYNDEDRLFTFKFLGRKKSDNIKGYSIYEIGISLKEGVNFSIIYPNKGVYY